MKLGSGTYGTVCVKRGEEDKAVKQFDSLSCLIREVGITRYMQSEHTVELISWSPSKKTMTTKRWSASLDNVLRTEKLTSTQQRCIHKSILKGLTYLEYRYIVHADLKPSNVFVNTDRTKAVLGDYGLSSINKAARVDCTAPGFAPNNTKAHRTHDLFSFVVLSLELLYGYRVRKELMKRSYLRDIVSDLVKDANMKEVLLAMIQDDYKLCMKASTALVKLYGKKEKLLKDEMETSIYRSIDDESKWLITQRVKELCKQFHISRDIRCYDVAISIASIVDVPKERLLLYASTMAYIFSCVFRRTKEDISPDDRMSIKHIVALDNCKVDDVYKCLITIFSDKEIVDHIYAP